TMRLLDFAEEVEVASVVLGSNWQDPQVLQQSPALLQHLWLAGRYEDALRLLDTIEPRVGPHPLLRYTRGQLQQYLGNFEAAASAYENALALDPALADVHWAIAKLRPDGSAARITRLRRALATPRSETARAQLLYALFHELDTADERDGAWSALAEGAAVMRAVVGTPVASANANAEAMMATAHRFGPTPAAPVSQPRPVFILGMPRSGTTLLDRMLGNHGWVTSAGERNDLTAAASEISDQFYRGLRQCADPQHFLASQDMPAIGHAYLQRLRRAAPATAVAIDKHPRNLFELPLILAALPQARIVCVRRDAMDVAFSNFKELFPGGAYGYSYDFAALADEVELAQRWMAHWQARAPEAVRIVDYRDLVENTEATLAGLLDFLQLPAWPGLAEPERNLAPVSTASSAQVRAPVHRNALDAWQRYREPLAPLAERLHTLGK
ncbi:MAG TPA: sulfotransferase, partial [Stenotrophomonas sp.]